MNRCTLSSRRHDWRTPASFFAGIVKRWPELVVDMFAERHNALLPRFWTAEDNTLAKDLNGVKGFANPEYGRFLPRALAHMAGCDENGKKVRTWHDHLFVVLCPARPGTKYWRQFVFPHAHDILWVAGRLRFDATCVALGCDQLAVGYLKGTHTTETGDATKNPTLCAQCAPGP
ncbi:MAG: DNA N-6-adenine-methyltransferase, partial [Nannocystaceae bacterium]